MKKLVLFTIMALLGTTQFVHAQQSDDDMSARRKEKQRKREEIQGEDKSNIDPSGRSMRNKRSHVNPAFCRKAYIGFSTGINNPCGIIGADVDIPVAKHVSVGAGVGISSWGSKVYLDAKYYLKPCHRGWAFGLGLTHSSGLSNYTSNLETVYGDHEDVTLDLKPQTNVFIAAYRYWTIGDRYNRFYVMAGYSAALTSDKYTQTQGAPLSDNSNNTVLAISPGGIILGVGLSFGVH